MPVVTCPKCNYLIVNPSEPCPSCGAVILVSAKPSVAYNNSQHQPNEVSNEVLNSLNSRFASLSDFSLGVLTQLSYLANSKTRELDQWLTKFNDSRKGTSMGAPNIKTPDMGAPNIETPHMKTPNIETPHMKTPHMKTPKENAENRRLWLSDEGEAQTFSSNGVTQAGAHSEDSFQQIFDDYRNGRITAEEFSRRKSALPKKNDFRPNSSQKSIVRGGIDRKRIILFTISILLLLGTLTAFSTSSSRREPDNRLKIPKGSSNYIGSDYSTVIAELQAAGFSNVQTAVLDDLIMGWLTKDGEVESVKVGGKTTFRAGSRYTPNVPIVVTYHTYPAKTTDRAKETAPQLNSLSVTASNTPNLTAPDIHAVSVNFPVKYALRAAVVAFTNYYATDVLTSDGNDYDISKFHSYADVAGFFMNVESEGTWTAKSKNTWHVDHLKLKIYEVGSVVDASLNVSYDGSRYKVSNLTGKGPSYPDISNLENERYFALCSSVPPALIQDDRNAAKVVARDHSGELPKRDARKAFEKYGQHKSYGFKCHWGSGLRYEEQRVDGSWFFKVEVIIQNQYGAKRKAIAEGVVKNNTTRSVEQFHVH